MSGWKLVKVSDLPVPEALELSQLRSEWESRRVLFFDGHAWRPGLVSSINSRGLLKILVWRDGAWVYGRSILFTFIPCVLRHAG